MAILTRAMTAADHAKALNTILKVTRRAWMLADPTQSESAASRESTTVHAAPASSAHPQDSEPRSDQPRTRAQLRHRRRCRLTDDAARAFEAQVMAQRCRQAFVA